MVNALMYLVTIPAGVAKSLSDNFIILIYDIPRRNFFWVKRHFYLLNKVSDLESELSILLFLLYRLRKLVSNDIEINLLVIFIIEFLYPNKVSYTHSTP